jgi:thiamine-phosphate pyrophosphorylase
LPPERKPIVCYVTDRRALSPAPGSASNNPADPDFQPLHDAIQRAAAFGAALIQIREKDLDARPLLDLVRFAVAAMQDSGARVLVNDRLDVALAAGAAGVHLGENSLPLETVNEWRRSAGRPEFLIGVSCHSLESCQTAARGGTNYVFFGPVFATPSKAAFGPPQGLERLREACQAVEIPVLAIGGITAENFQSCLEAGAAGIAAIRWLQEK